jgi:hypothetical protein
MASVGLLAIAEAEAEAEAVCQACKSFSFPISKQEELLFSSSVLFLQRLGFDLLARMMALHAAL